MSLPQHLAERVQRLERMIAAILDTDNETLADVRAAMQADDDGAPNRSASEKLAAAIAASTGGPRS